MRHLLLAAVLLSTVARPGNAFSFERPHSTGANVCDQTTLDALLAPSSGEPSEFVLNCTADLPPGTTVTKNVVFEGSEASGAVLNCNGSTIDATAGNGTLERIAVIVRSKHLPDGSWDAPRDVAITNCHVRGFIRIRGLDYTASGSNMKASSTKPDHTAFVQAASPRDTVLDTLLIEPPGNIALYVGPGVTGTVLEKSTFVGHTNGTAIYLDAESSRSLIIANSFQISTKSRELIAIDGSSRNRITGNSFENAYNGGIFIYRNCGEQGVIRHQKPEYNVIVGNTFRYDRKPPFKPAVWLGSRGGKQSYCFSDPQYPFGSSQSPLDYARNNTVEQNEFLGGSLSLIRNDDQDNLILDNYAE